LDSEQTLIKLPDHRIKVGHCLVLSALTIAAYLQVRDHHFVWDTIPFVLENPWIHAWTLENVIAMFTEAHRANWHPVVLLSHALDFSLFGDDAGWHHVTNLVLHIINALFLYLLVYLLLIKVAQPPDQSAWVAFLTAIIFALHPQHVESVAWVVERKDVLYSLFALACLISYVGLAESPRKWAWHLVPFLLFCTSIGAKPMAVTLPVILIMLDIFPLKRAPDIPALFRLCLEKWHYLSISIIVALVTLVTQAEAMPSFDNLPLWVRALNAMDNTLFYVAHYIWPLNLSPFYAYPLDASHLVSPAFWLPGLSFLGLLAAVCGWAWRHGHLWPGLLAAFYLVTLLPVSGLIHVGPAKATDHYVYLATIPLSLLTALGLVKAWVNWPRAKVVLLSTTITYVTFLFLITQLQVTFWNNPLSLWTRVITIDPTSSFGHRNLASSYAGIGEWQLASQHAEASLRFGSPDVEFVLEVREELKRAENRAREGSEE